MSTNSIPCSTNPPSGQSYRGAKIARWILSFALSFASTSALPQTAGLPDSPSRIIEEGLRREAQRLREQPGHSVRDSLRPSETKASPGEIPQETPCYVITSIELEGEKALFDRLRSTATPWMHHCLGVQGLRQLTNALDNELLAAGYATSMVTLPAQNLAAGTLRINVQAGRIAAIEADPGLYWVSAFPIASGDILNIRDLDQGVEQMNRLPSRTVQAEIEPGEAPDTSLVRIRTLETGSALRGGISLDNSGSPSLGRPHMSASLVFDNPIGLNDLVSFSVNTNLRNPRADHRSQSLAISYSIPWGYDLLTLSASTARFAQTVQLTSESVVSSGRSQGLELRWERTLWRNQSTKVGIQGGVSLRRSRSFIDDVELTVQNRRNSFATWGLQYKHLFQRASLDGEISVLKGMGWFGAEPDFDPLVSSGLTLRPLILNANVSLTVPAQTTWHSSLRLQYTRHTVLALDQFSIGSRGTVRGFDGTATLQAESGFAWRNEFSTPLKIGSFPAHGYVAVDVGRVWGPSNQQLAGRYLAGAAFGVRSQWRQLVFDVALALPLAKPSEFRSARLAPYFSLTYAF